MWHGIYAAMAAIAVAEIQMDMQRKQEKSNDPRDSMAIEGEVTGRWYEGQSETRGDNLCSLISSTNEPMGIGVVSIVEDGSTATE